MQRHNRLFSLVFIAILCIPRSSGWHLAAQNTTDMNQQIEQNQTLDHTNKRILARGCDPVMTVEFGKMATRVLGNPTYVPTSSDEDFLEKIKTEKWSVIFFAPGACRFSAANMHIPGGNAETANWSLDDYKAFVHKYQGDDIKIVETVSERETLDLLLGVLNDLDQ